MSSSEPVFSDIAPSALTSFITSENSSSTHPQHLYDLALQIQHNLQYQHRWTNLKIHAHSTIASNPLARPILSGLPPRRLYVHPDEQIEALVAHASRKKGKSNGNHADQDHEDDDYDLKFEPEEEWVLPTHLREEWSLQRFAEIFDDIEVVPSIEVRQQFEDGKDAAKPEVSVRANKWRTTKRMVLATLQDDSTVVYYIVHDGIVKPRQN